MTYSNTMAIGRQHTVAVSRGKNSVAFMRADAVRLGPVSNTVVLIVLACLLGLLYLTQVTKTNTYGYTMHQLQKEQTALKTEHDNLAAASARLQAIGRAESSAEAKTMVATAPSGIVR